MEKPFFSDVKERITPLANYLSGKHIGIHAAGAGYFIVLSVFPLLVLILSLLRYTGLQVQTLTDLVSGFVPQALMPSAKRLILSTYRNTSGAVVSRRQSPVCGRQAGVFTVCSPGSTPSTM